jgi:hypothetical protein
VSDWLDGQSNKCRLLYWILFDIASVWFVSELGNVLTHQKSCFGTINSCTGAR